MKICTRHKLKVILVSVMCMFSYAWMIRETVHKLNNIFQINIFHASLFHFFKTLFNIILPSTTGSSTKSLSLRSSYKNSVCAFPVYRTFYMARPRHSSWFHHLKNIWLKITNHEAVLHVVFFTPILTRPFWATISFSALYSRTSSAYVPPLMWETNFYTSKR
jgi:hypothetical protein